METRPRSGRAQIWRDANVVGHNNDIFVGAGCGVDAPCRD